MDANSQGHLPQDATPAQPQAIPTQAPADGVWISKEEYLQLKSQAPMQASPVQSQVIAGSSPDFGSHYVERGQRNMKDFWTYASAGIAVLIFVMLTFGSISWITVPAVAGVVIFAILAVVSLVKPKRIQYDLQPSASNPVTTKAPSSALKVVSFVATGIVLAIVAPFVLMIIFFFILLSSGASSGS